MILLCCFVVWQLKLHTYEQRKTLQMFCAQWEDKKKYTWKMEEEKKTVWIKREWEKIPTPHVVFDGTTKTIER